MEESLMEGLKQKNEYFKSMANLIPAQFYFEQEAKPVAGGKYFKNKEEKAPLQTRKEKSKKGANKLKRLDPTQHKTVTDIQNEMAAGVERQDADHSSDESEDEGVHSGNDSSDDKGPKRKKAKGSQPKPVSVEKVRTSTSLDELRGKLQKRIAELRLKRKATSDEGGAAVPKKMSKKMRAAERKKKEKMEAIQASKKKLQEAVKNKAKQREAGEEGLPNEGVQKPQKEEVSFSKFAFEEFDAAKEKKMKRKKKKRDDPRSGKDYVRLLKKVEKHNQELTDLKEKDPEKAEQVITKEKWQKAFNKAQGVKVKDDPELLKKSMRREKHKKKRSAKAWKSREKQTQKLIKEKQEKRNKNIQARKDSKKAKKVKRLQKKGKLLLQD